jgi:DNA-binding GntR family transcriptional regulator
VWAKYPFDMLGALPNRAEQVASEHDAIMQGLRIRDPRATMRAMQRHLELGHRLLKANYALRATPDP